MNEYPDEEVINLISENSEEAGDYIYKKYSYIVDIIIAKYKTTARYFSVDLNELRQEALLGFSDAIAKYDVKKDSSLATFISIVTERRVGNYIKKHETNKNKIINQMYSLDTTLDEEDKITLQDVLGDNSNDPQKKIEEKESMKEITEKINEILSPSEKEVYDLMINGFGYMDIASILNKNPKQIDNAIQRIRNKIKGLI